MKKDLFLWSQEKEIDIGTIVRRERQRTEDDNSIINYVGKQNNIM